MNRLYRSFAAGFCIVWAYAAISSIGEPRTFAPDVPWTGRDAMQVILFVYCLIGLGFIAGRESKS